MSFDPVLPKPSTDNWREAYLLKKDITKGSSYQAPGTTIWVPFILDSVKISGGNSIDTAEFPFNGFWSNTHLNEKPQTISISGFVRGDEYIENRNTLIEALRVATCDEKPGYLELPLWGRFPVIVSSWDLDESGNRNGQCGISMSFIRAGILLKEEADNIINNTFDYDSTSKAVEKLKDANVETFSQNQSVLSEGFVLEAYQKGFSEIKNKLNHVMGRIQGPQEKLNDIANSINTLTNLAAQGVKEASEYVSAAFNAVEDIVNTVIEIKNDIEEVASVLTVDNAKNVLLQFLSHNNIDLDFEAFSNLEVESKKMINNLFKMINFSGASLLLSSLSEATYNQVEAYWDLFHELEESLDKNDVDIYSAIDEVCISVSRNLADKQFNAEITKTLDSQVPLLYLSNYLSCSERQLRQLNNIADSFAVNGDIIYV